MLYKRCGCQDERKCRHPYWYKFNLNATTYSRSTKTANVQAAGRIEDRRRAAILENRDEQPKESIKLSKHVVDYLAHTKEHNKTANKDEGVLDRLVDLIGDHPLKDISAFQIEKWKLVRAKQVVKSTVNRELNIIRGCFSRAVEWDRLKRSPLDRPPRAKKGGVEIFQVDDQRIRVLDNDELRKLLNAEGDDDAVLTCRITLETLARISEVMAMHKSHIGPTWVEFRRKGGKVMRAPITGELRKELLARCEENESGLVFKGQGDKPPTQQCASNRVLRLLERLNIKGASHHTMRHTGVTLMLENGVNPLVIKALAGWSSLRMLERYGHARDAELRRAVEENADHLRKVAAGR